MEYRPRIRLRSILMLLLIATGHGFSAHAQNDSLFWPTPDSLHAPDVLFLGYSGKRAEYDLRKGRVIVLLPGGFIGTPLYHEDSLFMEKYHIQYQSLGCIQMVDDDYAGYNRVMFRYLDRRYGHSWRKRVHKDVFGRKELK